MKNKGFTLVELLAIIGILSVLTVITIPTIDSIIKKNKEKLFNQQIETIRNGLKTWGDANVDRLPEKSGDAISLNLGYIKSEGFVKPDLVNPKNKQCFANDIKLYIKRVNENYEYLVDYESGSIPTEFDCDAGDLIYVDEVLNGADPILSNGLIPVSIADDGTVKRADIYSDWYNYSEKRWANAVILKDTGKIESDGTILENSIESYFVWVPRFRYKLFDLGEYSSAITGTPTSSKAKEIEIKFENKYTDTIVGKELGDYHSHPAFQTFNANGLWVGKFETTGTVTNIEIKPGKRPINNINVKTMFELALNYRKENASHMMKNTEWGAVVYLLYSKYGVAKEININNNSRYYTGYSAAEGTNQSIYPGTTGTTSSVTQPYNTVAGYKATTTGNITGIYDMSGGSSEYMASYKYGYLSESGFDVDPVTTYGAKYFDVYPANSAKRTYNKRILGDATGELGPFYYYADSDGNSRYHNTWGYDVSNFVDSSMSWFSRSAIFNEGVLAGPFYFTGLTGKEFGSATFRLVLAK